MTRPAIYSTAQDGGRRGAALIIALSLLATFSLMGTFYLRSMQLELENNTLEVRAVRAQQAAAAGIQAAIGGLYTGLEDDQLHLVLGEGREISFPIYTGQVERSGPEALVTLGIEAADTHTTKAILTIEDESGKVNLNHVPASVLQELLGLEGETARRINSSLPHSGMADEAGWFTHPDELVSRGFLSASGYGALDKQWITVNSVLDQEAPGPYLNVNRAPSAVLAAVLGLPLDRAEELREQGPYETLEALGQAAEVDVYGLTASPLLRTDSRCFRIHSTGITGRADGRGDLVSAAVEAVVIFDGQGAHHIVSWRTVPASET